MVVNNKLSIDSLKNVPSAGRLYQVVNKRLFSNCLSINRKLDMCHVTGCL